MSTLTSRSGFFILTGKTCGNRSMRLAYSYNKGQQAALFPNFNFGKGLYMFRTDLLPIISSLNTVFTAIGICHIS